MSKTKNLILSAFFLALCIILPTLVGAVNPVVGSVISPMHIPVLLCGFVCGKNKGLLVGFMAPLLKVAVYGVPMMFIAVPMCFELALYGFFAGLFYEKLPKKIVNIYVSLIAAMILGRVGYGIITYFVTSFALLGASGGEYTLAMFLASGAVFGGIPAIISHIVIIPPIIYSMKIAMKNTESDTNHAKAV